MDTTIPYLRTQGSLLDELRIKVRGDEGERWDNPLEYYTALNEVLYVWADQVKMPHVYTIPGGYLASIYEYTLPNYLRPPFYPELLRRVPYYDYTVESLTERWQPAPGWEVVGNGAGGQVLRLYSPPRNVEGQVGFYSPNSRVPVTIPETSGSTSSTATTMTLGSAVDVDEVGHVKVDSEILAYYGVTYNASTTVLNNLIRGLNGTTAATHDTAREVQWCIGVDTPALWGLLFDMWKSRLHAYYMQDGGTHETGRHEKGMGYYDQKEINFWARYKPRRQSQDITLNQKAFALRR